MNMRGTPRVVMVMPWIGTRLDGHKTIMTIRVTQRAAKTGEVRVQRRTMLIAPVPITARRIGLPTFDLGVRHWPIVFIEHTTTDDDAFTHWLAVVLQGFLVAWATRVAGMSREVLPALLTAMVGVVAGLWISARLPRPPLPEKRRSR